MATITDLDIESGLGISGASSPYFNTGGKPLLEPGQKVYRLSDMPPEGSAGDNQKAIPVKEYTVLPGSPGLRSGLDATVMKLLDQGDDATVPSLNDGSTTRPEVGWNHTNTTLGDTKAATTLSSPWHYRLFSTQDQRTVYDVHESDLTGITELEAYISARVLAGDWVS